MSVKLAAVILTCNEERHIAEAVRSAAWCDEVVVVDTYSTDHTVERARASGARVICHDFENFAQIRNVALDRVEAEWILFLDADERVTPALADEIKAELLAPSADGYWIPRHNYIFGKLTLGGGWFPDHQMRLLLRACARYERPVHEVVVLDGDEGYLQNVLVHYNYETVAQFRQKQRRYAAFDAQILREQGERPRFYTYLTQPARQFWWRFVTLKGYRDGLHGLRLCAMMAWYEFCKYTRLRALLNQGSGKV
jgi:glycosyltransferase involved in cell wall biosynthesis